MSLISVNTFLANAANKYSQTFQNIETKKKTEKEEVKELLQNPEDPLAQYPVRAMGYANEVGAALSTMPGWGKTAEVALWIPALLYLGADIYDKYSRGKEGNYSEASVNKAVEQATFQALASVILPTAAVKMGQNIAGIATKYDGSNLTASAQEELYGKILSDFDKGKFAKGDYIKPDGTVRKGIDRVMDRILNDDFDKLLSGTKQDLKTEGLWAKVKRFFTHSSRPVSAATSNRTDVDNFVRNKVNEIYSLQTKLENITEDSLSALDSRTRKYYNKALKNIDAKVQQLIAENPSIILKKILNSGDDRLKTYQSQILDNYQGDSLKLLLRDKNRSAKLLSDLMAQPEDRDYITKFVKKVKIARDTLRPIVKGKEMRLGWLKTAGGFIALGCLAIPIDHFVHKYIIEKAVAPALENVEKFNQNFKKKAH